VQKFLIQNWVNEGLCWPNSGRRTVELCHLPLSNDPLDDLRPTADLNMISLFSSHPAGEVVNRLWWIWPKREGKHSDLWSKCLYCRKLVQRK
jgi:hypothetical protein